MATPTAEAHTVGAAVVPFKEEWLTHVETQSGPTTFPFFYKLPQALQPADIDTSLWRCVVRINYSGWVWTAESCEGHPEGPSYRWASNDGPYLRLVTKAKNEKLVLYLLERALRNNGLFGEASHPVSMRNVPNHGLAHSTWRNANEASPWVELLVYVLNPDRTLEARDAGVLAWGDFAASLYEPRVQMEVR